MITLTLKLKGTKPMLQHNGRLANPLDEYTRKLAALTKKRNKTDDDLVAIMEIEARGGCWETPDNFLGIQNAAVWASIQEAARAYKLGKDIKRALHFEDTTEPMMIDGQTITCDDFLSEPTHIDYRPVKIQGRKTMRARPLIPKAWESIHTFTLLGDVMQTQNLHPVLIRAGRLVGLGDWRPTYGTYEVEVA